MRRLLIGIIVMLAAGSVFGQDNPLETKANKASSASASELANLGNLYVEAMRLTEAKSTYKKALKLEAKNGEAEFGMVRIDMAKGKLERSKKACRRVRRRHKSETVGDVCSGWVWLTFDRSTRAIDEFEKVVSGGDEARGYTGLAEAYRRRADDAKAIDTYKKALSAGAGYIAQMGLGLAQESNGDTAAAIASLKKAADMEPASCKVHFHYGRMLGQGAEAVNQLRIALAIRPDWSKGHETLGKILLYNKDFNAAKSAFEKAVEIQEKSGEANMGLGKALYLLGKKSDAKIHLEKAVALVPNLVDAYLLLADIEYEEGDSDTAIKALEKAKSVAPGVVRVYLHTGKIYFRLGRHTKANSYLKRAVQMKSNLSSAYTLLGDIACKRRLYDEGQKFYKKALGGDMKDITTAEINKRKSTCKSAFK